MSTGYAFLHRRFLESDIWEDHDASRLMIYLICKVNWKHTTQLDGRICSMGELHTKMAQIVTKTGLTRRKIQRCLAMLRSKGTCTVRSTAGVGMVITLCHWEDYQNVLTEKGRSRGRSTGRSTGRSRDYTIL